MDLEEEIYNKKCSDSNNVKLIVKKFIYLKIYSTFVDQNNVV